MRSLLVLLLLLPGCAAFQGKPRSYGVGKVDVPALHNIDTMVGYRGVWKSGAACEVLVGRRSRVDEPSSRGLPEQMLFESRVDVPLGR